MKSLEQNKRTNLHQLMFTVLAALLLFNSEIVASASNENEPTITLVLGSTLIEPLSAPTMDGFVDLIAKEAFKRIGVNIVVQPLPSERSLRNANSGVIDGDLLRVGNIGEIYKNLVIVPETIMTLDFVAFTKSVELPMTNWETIEPFSLGLIRGWKIYEIYTRNAKNVTKVKNGNLLFKLLDKGRADIVLHERFEGYGIIKKLGFTQMQILEPPLASKKMFIYLNKKHARLADNLAKELRAMKQDGTFERIHNNILANYIPKT